MKKLLVSIGIVMLLVGTTSVAMADQLKKGDKEMLFSFSYEDLSFDGGGDLKTTDLSGAFGYLLTDANELGGTLLYSKVDAGSGGSVDSTLLGIFYHYNFKAGTNLNPYIGGFYNFVSGDTGDVFDNVYGLELGIKVYPWSNGGFNFGVNYSQWTGADTNPDADGLRAFAGVLLKF